MKNYLSKYRFPARTPDLINREFGLRTKRF